MTDPTAHQTFEERTPSPKAHGAEPRNRGFLPIACLYGMSGLLGLVYEVAFSKYLTYVFGITAYASSAVLVAFLSGLAAGAYGFGRFAHKVRRPLEAYGWTEIAIGAFCIASPWLFRGVTGSYVAFVDHGRSLAVLSAIRWLLAGAVVFVPAVGMGVTLPALSSFVGAPSNAAGTGGAASNVSALYGINTAGGALGALGAAYFVLPSLGLATTMAASGAASITIGAVAIRLAKHGNGARATRAAGNTQTDAAARALRGADRRALREGAGLATAALSGFQVFACEVAFTHLLALVMGTTVYAFALMLAAFLICLALGAPIADRFDRVFGRAATAASLAASGLALACSLPVWDQIPGLFVRFGPSVQTWAGREAVRGLVALGALVTPVCLMGTTFPLVLRRTVTGRIPGAGVARVSAANTAGAIAGSVLAGFVVLPWLGSQRTLQALAAVYGVGGLFAIGHGALRSDLHRARAALAGASLATIATASFVPRWDLHKLTSGTNIYFERPNQASAPIVMMREDVHAGVTTVTQEGGGFTLWMNGKFQGNQTSELSVQRGFGHLPSLFAKRLDTALVIGMGTGTTAGTIAAYPYNRIEIADVSPASVEAAGRYFASVNGRVLDDPRVVVRQEDGRNLLLMSRTRYDVITIELSGIWHAHAGNLYNREFYELAANHLTEGGVLQQWIQFHHTTARETATLLNTVRAAFPHVLVFRNQYQGHLLASAAPLTVSASRLESLAISPRLRPWLASPTTLRDLVAGVMLDEAGVDAFVRETCAVYGLDPEALVSTDDNMRLEYATPRNNLPDTQTVATTVAQLERFRRPGLREAHVQP